jgi:hypothetical protein
MSEVPGCQELAAKSFRVVAECAELDFVLRMKADLNKILAKHTGKTVKKIQADHDTASRN